MPRQKNIFGISAEFLRPEDLVAAARRIRAAGYRNTDAFSPFPVHGLAEALDLPKTKIPLITLVGGLSGALFGYFMLWYANVVAYPWNIGGRPPNSWEAFIPITFEMGVLGASLSAVFGMLLLNGLPRLYHPMFNVPGFDEVSKDRFFLVIETSDPMFDHAGTRKLLEDLRPASIAEVAR